MYTLRQYLMTLSDPDGLTRTLGEVEVCRDTAGRMCFSVGNSAVVFRIRHEGRIRSLRGYLRPQRHLREIYGKRLLEKELYLYTSPRSGVWVDVVLGEWIEGVNLHEAITRAATARDTERLAELSADFDRLAAAMIADDRAHGDLKPENILVDENGRLHPIDFDASYLPCFAGETSPELGTAAYQHPARRAEDFNERLDDYPAALISTALHALCEDPTLWERYGNPDSLLYDPRHIATDPALRESIARFEERGLALCYRIAQLLHAPRPELPDLRELLAEAARRAGRDAEKRPIPRTERGGGGISSGGCRIGGAAPGTVRRTRALGIPDSATDSHPAALRQRFRLHGGVGGRSVGAYMALHRPRRPHAPELSGLRRRETLPQGPGPDPPRRPLARGGSLGPRV